MTISHDTPHETESDLFSGSRFLSTICLAALLAIASLRMLVAFDPFPYWAGDPLQRYAPLVSLGPGMSLVLDAASVLLSGIAAWAGARIGLRPRPAAWGLWFGGACVAITHAGFGSHATLQHWIAGGPWIAALAAAAALLTLAQLPVYRRLVLCVFAGLTATLFCKCIVQVYIEHPALVESFNRDKLQIFQENGWSPDSSMARAYERRLLQAEGMGWIGLANPLATFAAAATVAGVGGMLLLTRTVKAGLPWGVLAAIGVVMVYLAGAKGGFAASAGGIGLVLVARFLPRSLRIPSVGVLLGLTMTLGVVALVIARGLIGDRLGELSIYFRSMYVEAAARIFSMHPVIGVGPAGFKDAYLLAKNPLNPEEVASPHSVLFDYLACLGLGGLAWCGCVLLFATCAGRRLLTGHHDQHPPLGPAVRTDIRLAVVILAVPTLIGAFLESQVGTPEAIGVRLIGLAMGSVLCAFLMLQSISVARLGVVAAAVALTVISHGQIELTPILATTAMLWAILAATAAAPNEPPAPAGAAWCRLVPLLFSLAITLAIGSQAPRIMEWEQRLEHAAGELRPLADVRQLRMLADRDPRALPEAAAVATEALRQTVPPDASSIDRAMNVIASQRIPLATEELEQAAASSNGDPATLRALSQFYVQTPGSDGTRTTLAIKRAQQATEARLGRASSSAWLGTVLNGLYVQDKKPEQLAQAIEAYKKAAALDPSNLPAALKIVELAELSKNALLAKEWATQALERHARTRLDPLKGLTAEQLAHMRSIAGQQ